VNTKPISWQAEPARRRSSSCAARRSRSSRFAGPGSAEAPDFAVSGSVTNSRPWTWRASCARRYRGWEAVVGAPSGTRGSGRGAPVGRRRIGAIVRTAGGRGRHRLPRADAPPVSSRARHTQGPPGSDCVESHPRGLPGHRPSGSLIRSESQMTQRDRGRAWSHRLEDTPRPPAPRAANRMALVPTRCRSLEPMAGAARNPCHGRVPQRTGRLHHR